MLLSAFSVGCVSIRECKRYGDLQYSMGRLDVSLRQLEESVAAAKDAQLKKEVKVKLLERDSTIREERVHSLSDPCRDLNYEQCKDKMRGIRYGDKE